MKSMFRFHRSISLIIIHTFPVISDFGGLLGLFMGCSLLSIVEIFFYILIGFQSLCVDLKERIHPAKTKTWAEPVSKLDQSGEVLKALSNLSRKIDDNQKENNQRIRKVEELIGDTQKKIDGELKEIKRRLTRLEIYDIGM